MNATEFWDDLHERRAAETPKVNARLAEIAGPLAPGTALDLGCGGGGDAVWLAARGWRVTAVDISGAAVRSLRARGEPITALRVDLAEDFPDGTFDLVSAQYFHTPFELDRARVLRTAAGSVNPGGLLVVVDHGSAAPWSWSQDADYPSPDEVAAGLELDPADWSIDRAEAAERLATGPAGRTATVIDHVLVLRRTGR
ncbi:SAM-dependent methyltransferase [Amycolatopsis sp. WAC 04182]|uniref:class I SAM-dependent methyltransferase n=1 Tax=Amycolatopsis sp. WAC 04182 TaxID=2203198 RepID=UPI000F78F104|nr:methyltransferase domain-containing protein [Amycolatopsis sp. WAC 04182]RSN55524.1 SAM-dependent methyltransferase [Amycolatopsis sp. WAC 04182]